MSVLNGTAFRTAGQTAVIFWFGGRGSEVCSMPNFQGQFRMKYAEGKTIAFLTTTFY
jgi:hypothetical protein